VVYQGGTPIFCDINEQTLNIDPQKVEQLITQKTRAIIMVDYAGQVPDYHRLINICKKNEKINKDRVFLIEDSAHSIGLQVTNCPTKPYVGNFADITCFSFHPVKNMTTGEGGMTTTNNPYLAERMKRFRTHGITTEYQNRTLHGYDIPELGFNYRLTDFQCALGINQLKRLPQWIQKRQEIAKYYDEKFKPYHHLFTPLTQKHSCAYHLYVIKLNLNNLNTDRDTIFQELKDRNLGVNVHYVPTHHLTYYRNRFLFPKGHPKHLPTPNLPITDQIYQEIITLPLSPTLPEEEINWVVQDTIEVITSKEQQNY
jgi:perosamine synthetase